MRITREQAEQMVSEYGNVSKAARAAGIARSTFADCLKKGSGAAYVRENGAVESPKDKGGMQTITIDDVVTPHDKVGQTLAILKGLPAGQLVTDETLRKEVGLGEGRWRGVRGSTRLNGHWYACPDKSIVWGGKSTISSLEAKIKEVL